MKSSFILSLIIGSLVTSVALGQTNTSRSNQAKSSFDKFYERLKISYTGVFTSPHFDDMEKGNWDNASISPEFGQAATGDTKNQDTWPTNVWNQLSFRYNFGAKMDFVVAPRWMTPLSHPVDMKAPEDRSLIALEDALIGFQGVVYTSDDKKFNFWIRPGVRLPVSRLSRNATNKHSGTNVEFGKISNQVELAYTPTYDFNSTWQLGLSGQFRVWVYEDRYNYSRMRITTSPYVQYTIDDTTRLQVHYENMLENNKRWKSINNKDPVFKDVWQNVVVGVNKDVTKKLNIFPFLGTFVNDEPITDKSLWLGAIVSYTIK